MFVRFCLKVASFSLGFWKYALITLQSVFRQCATKKSLLSLVWNSKFFSPFLELFLSKIYGPMQVSARLITFCILALRSPKMYVGPRACLVFCILAKLL